MSSRPKICLIHTPEVYYEQNYGTRFAPVWAYTLASHIGSGWDVEIFDTTVEPIAKVPEADIYGFSGQNQDFHCIKKNYTTVKEKFPNKKYILGGPIAWSFEKNGNIKDLLYFDHVFILDGEAALPKFLDDFLEKKPQPQIIRSNRFDLANAKKIHFEKFKDKASLYYGGVLEVARGCPFLCEFCDIRVLPQNNELHAKKVELIVQELDEYHRLGIRQIQLACDNFIGDLRWANECVDAILEWTHRTGAKVALHTWVTVNFSGQPELMKKMRQAGFTSLFIGVESFNANSVLETSKLQNKNGDNQLIEALQKIHSFGFLIAPGLIFGFDSDTPEMFEDTTKGVRDSGLVGGDPTFLLALPGTPLYQRMKMSGRLILPGDEDNALSLEKERVSKIESNIRYLQPQDFLVYGYIQFIKRFISPAYAFERFQKHTKIVTESPDLVAVHALGYGNLKQYLMFQISTFTNFRKFLMRMLLLIRPSTFWTVARAYWLVLKNKNRYAGLKNHFYFWLFTWTNLVLKYSNIKAKDFKIRSIDEAYNLEKIWEYKNHSDPNLKGGRSEEGVKVALQYKSTQEALKSLEKSYKEGNTSREQFKKAASAFKKAA